MKKINDPFLKEYNGVALEKKEEVVNFFYEFDSYLRRVLPDCKITGISIKDYVLSTFIERGGKYMYLGYAIPRHGREVDIECKEDVLFRTAPDKNVWLLHHGEDYRCSLASIPEAVTCLLETGRYIDL